MGQDKIFIASGCKLTNDENGWQNIFKEKLNCNLYDLTEENIGNALISRKLIYKVNELIKIHKPEDIVVGIMWTIPDIHERYITEGKNDDYVGRSQMSLTNVVDDIKNWRILNHQSITVSEDCELYYKVIYNWLQSYILSVEHILRTQWFLTKLGIKYFMTTHLDIFHEDENYLKMYDFSKLKEFNKRPYRLNILMFSEVIYLYDMIQKETFLPINGMLEWLQEHHPNDGFKDSEKLIPNSFGHEKFVTDMIIPFLKDRYEIDLFW
jgi:hypothetical protein